METYTSHNGLISSRVNNIYQDSAGYLWIGTTHGLFKFDGIYFNIISQRDGLISRNVLNIIEDKDGTLWFGTANGVSKLRDGVITNYTVNDGLASGQIMSMLADDNFIWFGTRNGISKYSKIHQRFEPVDSSQALIGRRVFAIHKDRNGHLWFGTDKGVIRIDEENVTRYSVSNGLPGLLVRTIAEDDDGCLWFGTDGGGIAIMKNGEFIRTITRQDGLSSNRIWTLMKSNDGNMWIGTFGGGVSRFIDGDFFILSTIQGLPSNTVNAIFQDMEGSIWLGTSAGLVRLLSTKIWNYSTVHGLPNNNVVGIVEDDTGNIWLGIYDNGIVRYDGESFTHCKEENELASSVVRDIAVGKNNVVWFTTPKGICKYVNNSFTNYTIEDGLPYHVILSLHEDEKGTLWIGTYGAGISYLHKNTFTNFSAEHGLPNDVIWTINEDRDGNIWFGTNSGVRKYSNKNVITYRHTDGLASDSVYAIAFDANGIPWFATDRGLSKYHNGIFTNYTIEDGLLDNVCHCILVDNDNSLWIGTIRGVSRFDGTRFYNYTTASGLISNEINRGAGLIDRNGSLWFGTTRGLVKLIPELGEKYHIPPPINITSVKINDRNVELKKNHKLKYNENHIEFEFVGISFQSKEDIQYRYKLVGLYSDWRVTSARKVLYLMIPPGNYTFMVTARNKHSLWSENSDSFTFIIAPPYWASYWFRGLLLGLIILSIIGIHKQRVSKLREIENLRTSIACDLHDDIGASLTRVAVSSEVIQTTSDLYKIKSHAIIIGSVSREIIQTMSDIIWSIDSRNDDLEELCKRIQAYTHYLLSQTVIDYNFKCIGIDHNKKISIDIRQNIYLLFKEALNNSVKHAGASMINVVIENSFDCFILSIQDNGIGLYEETSTNGQGMKNMRLRAERIDGLLELINDNGLTVKLIIRSL